MAAASAVVSLDHQSRVLHARYLRTRASLVRVTELAIDEIVGKVRSRPQRRAAAGKPHGR